MGDFVSEQKSINSQLNQKIDNVESTLNKKIDGMKSKLFQNLNNKPILAPSVSHLNIWWKNVPPFQQQEKCSGNKLT